MTVTHLSDPELTQLAGELHDALPPLDPEEQSIAVALYRLLAEGKPVTDERLAQAAEVASETVAHALGKWPGVYRNDAGEVIGFWGLTLSEMPPHAFHVDGRRLWTWCAWDSLFIPAVLNKTARVDSICATTGEPVQATVGPNGVEQVSPAGAVISFLRPKGKFDHDVILSFCHHVLFFSSPQAGEQWIADRQDVFLLSLEQGFELGRRGVQAKYADALALNRAA